nr:hypothetical protein [Tanacetum cinerariifolium]
MKVLGIGRTGPPLLYSIAELEWAQAAKRLPEKLKEEAKALGVSPSMVHHKKRIILIKQLMQVLFRPVLAGILSDDDVACYNTVTYFAARLALGDACSLVKMIYLRVVVIKLIARAKKLEDEIL